MGLQAMTSRGVGGDAAGGMRRLVAGILGATPGETRPMTVGEAMEAARAVFAARWWPDGGVFVAREWRRACLLGALAIHLYGEREAIALAPTDTHRLLAATTGLREEVLEGLEWGFVCGDAAFKMSGRGGRPLDAAAVALGRDLRRDVDPVRASWPMFGGGR